MIAEDETKVFYGTPLAVDDDEEEAPRKKPVPVEQQEVRDERGIRRFHGAFTGGFSAGYFNTVGSKEGWAPSNFLSSRETRAGKQGQSRPEDYMDSEDLGVFGIAPRAIKVNKDFDEEKGKGNSSVRKRQFQFNDGPIPGAAPLKDLIVPSRESAGVKLLRKMGWKPGQGIGPRVKRKSKKTKKKTEDDDDLSPVRMSQEPGVKVYGCSLPENFSGNENSDDEDDYELLKGITFAPDDVEVLAYKTKDDFHGIGYKGLDRNPVLATFRSRKEIAAPPVRDKKKKLAIAGEAFGVGAFEEDDDNIYMVDDMSQYDFELGGSSSKSDKKNKKDDSKKTVGYIGEVLEGFHLSSKPPPLKKRYPPPALPKDYQPFYNKTTKQVEPQPAAVEKKEVVVFDRHRLTATERAEVIGNEKQVGSVFELMRPEDRARLKAIQKGAPPTPIVIGGPLSTSIVDRRGGFQPFGRDPDKQKRYDLYQKFKQSNKEDVFSKCQPSTMTEWEKQREVEEFRQAAAIYKPLAHSMAMRFTTAKHGDTDIIPTDKSKKPSDAVEAKPVENLKYGSGTRARIEWHPDRLLCRRFNVPDPYPESTMVGVYKIKKDRFSIFDLLNGNQSRAVDNLPDDNSEIELPDSPVDTEPTTTSSKVSKEPQKVVRPNLFDALDDIDVAPNKPVAPSTSNTTQNPQIEINSKTDENSEEKRPPMDLFKAIFEDTESEKESEDDEEEEENEVEKATLENSKKISVADVLAQSSVSLLDKTSTDKTKLGGPRLASGVFANLDLDSPNLTLMSESRRMTSVAIKATTKSLDIEDSYGPVLPPHLRKPSFESNDMEYGPRLPTTTNRDSSNSRHGQNRITKHHKEKHKRRHKKKSKKKQGSKHKRRKDSDSSEESSSNSESPADAMNLNKLLKSRLKSLKKPIILD